MTLLSMMRTYGSTSTTSLATAASPIVETADAMPPAESTPEVAARKTQQELYDDDKHDQHVRRRGGGKRTKTGFMIIPAAYSLLLVSVVMAITASALIQPIQANPTCILNCAQCVKIYGEFFNGGECARVCLDSRSSKFESFVDCADPTTIARFLKSF